MCTKKAENSLLWAMGMMMVILVGPRGSSFAKLMRQMKMNFSPNKLSNLVEKRMKGKHEEQERTLTFRSWQSHLKLYSLVSIKWSLRRKSFSEFFFVYIFVLHPFPTYSIYRVFGPESLWRYDVGETSKADARYFNLLCSEVYESKGKFQN